MRRRTNLKVSTPKWLRCWADLPLKEVSRLLPPGQVEATEFARFGLPWFAGRFPTQLQSSEILVAGDVAVDILVSDRLRALPRIEQVSDFHCVTSWSRRALCWGGIRFRDFYERIVLPEARPTLAAEWVVFIGQDGYCNSLPLGDLLADDVLLADRLDGTPLAMEHGAPLRLVAPAHYGYKSVKHVKRIEFWRDRQRYRFPGPGMIDHPRARVALQERGKFFPGWLLRAIYRPGIGLNAWVFRRYTTRFYQHQARKRDRV
jgi:DMSO/TMAO reductase YedYZ molybdopterin-dependent catalytic subunit